MTVDHLPPSIADLVQAPEDTDTCVPAGKPDGAVAQREEKPEPAADSTAPTDELWQQAGFGSFP